MSLSKKHIYLQIKEFKLINAQLLLGLFQLNDKQPPCSQNPTILVQVFQNHQSTFPSQVQQNNPTQVFSNCLFVQLVYIDADLDLSLQLSLLASRPYYGFWFLCHLCCSFEATSFLLLKVYCLQKLTSINLCEKYFSKFSIF